jgi:hypothetical protein
MHKNNSNRKHKMGLLKNFLDGNRHIKEVKASREIIGPAIAIIVMDQYEKNPAVSGVSASVFGAQVMNYVMGTKIDTVLNEVSPDVRQQIERIKDREVPEYVMALLKHDDEIKEAVVLSLQHLNIISRAYSKTERIYNSRPEGEQVNRILNTFAEGQLNPSTMDTKRLMVLANTLMHRAKSIRA